jgi:CBS domain-containing protein
MSSVDSIMQEKIVTAAADESVADIAQRMKDDSIGAVLVVEDGGLAGVFSERDLVTRVVAKGRDPAKTPVGDVATREIVSVGRNASIRECAEQLRTHGIRHLPVVEGDRPVGIISARDFFDAISGGLERFIERARYDEDLRGSDDPYDHIGGSYGR